MRFADIESGQTFDLGPSPPLSEGEILAFARDWDPQWFHTDPERAVSGRWNGLIASGWQTCGIAMRMVVEGLLKDSESYASPGLSCLKWLAPVRPGDRLRLRVAVLEKRHSASGRVGSVR